MELVRKLTQFNSGKRYKNGLKVGELLFTAEFFCKFITKSEVRKEIARINVD